MIVQSWVKSEHTSIRLQERGYTHAMHAEPCTTEEHLWRHSDLGVARISLTLSKARTHHVFEASFEMRPQIATFHDEDGHPNLADAQPRSNVKLSPHSKYYKTLGAGRELIERDPTDRLSLYEN